MKFALLLLTSYCLFTCYSFAEAQVIEDGTLSTEVNTDNNSDFTVNAGEQRGNNLFHSFSEFSIPNNGSAYFNNALSIENIITRVTGSSISNINGLIENNGTANLFLINPNGIIFGENARLNIGGAFVGTTAESVVFEDGTEFSTNLDDTEALLTVSVPLGLQFGRNPGEIINRANFSIPNPFDPTGQDQIKLGLTTPPNKTFMLLGGDITFDGGAVASSGGNIELGSVGENSFVALESMAGEWQANYDNVSQFQDITLDNLASVDASGEGGGSINVRSRNIEILNGSAIASNTFGDVDGGTIKIQASDLVEINGSDTTGTKIDLLVASFEIFLPFASQITSSTSPTSSGKAGNIEIVTNDLQIIDGGAISLLTFPDSSGKGGDLFVSASKSITLNGFRPLIGVGENAEEEIQKDNPSISLDEAIEFNQSSGITNSSISQASGGDINIESGTLRLENGSGVATSPFRIGDAGDINIKTKESVEIIGVSGRTGSVGTAIGANTFSQGNAGNINLETSRLSILDGGVVISSTSVVGGGNAGNITIDTQLTEINGVSSSSQTPTLLSSETRNDSIGGDILINTDSLIVSDRGILNIEGTGTGSPGNLQVNANSILLTNNARITAENTAAFEGGNISLDVLDTLTLENNSLISARALGDANGGNVNINASFVVANPNENNDVLATAVRGNGGNITIGGEGIFGIQEGLSNPPNSRNDIDASSEFGTDGTVNFNFPEINDSNFEEIKSSTILDRNTLLSSNFCKISLASEYYFTGKGGIAFSPDLDLPIENSWSDFRFFDDEVAEVKKTPEVETVSTVKKLEPIRGWFKDSKGQIILTAKPLVITSNSSESPHPNCNI